MITAELALIACGGNHNLSECAQFPFSAWLRAQEDLPLHEAQSYWQWVATQANAEGLDMPAIQESADSYRRRHLRLPGALH